MKGLTFSWIVILITVFGVQAQDLLVVPGQYSNTTVNSSDNAPLGAVNQHIQQDYAGSLLATSGLMPGDEITAIGFRIESGQAGLPAQTVSDYSIWMGLAANSPGNMSTTFADNGSDMTQVRSGPLTISDGQFAGGSSVNPFGMIELSLPYTYTGGDLLIEITYSGFASGGNVDAEYPCDAGLAQSAFGTGSGSTTADQGLFSEAIVMGLNVVQVPEPSAVAMFAGGALSLFLISRWRGRHCR
jgi:hypothetical protein